MEAAEAWIGMIESPETKATPEAKAKLIAQIREAVPKVHFVGIGQVPVQKARLLFTEATNAIKAEIRKREM